MRSKTLTLDSLRSRWRTSAFSSGFCGSNAPFARIKLQSLPKASRAGISSGSLSS